MDFFIRKTLFKKVKLKMEMEEILDVILHELEGDLGTQWGTSKDYFEKEVSPFAEKVSSICNRKESGEVSLADSKKEIEKLRPDLNQIVNKAEEVGIVEKGLIKEKFFLKSMSILTQFLE